MSIELNWEHLAKSEATEFTSYSYSDYKQHFTKVAVDLYKAKNSPAQLWELRDGGDGNQYFFALYDIPENVALATKQDWTAAPDSTGGSVTLAYKQTPIHRFETAKFNVKSEDASDFATYIEKSAQKKDWVAKLLNTMEPMKKVAVLKIIGEV